MVEPQPEASLEERLDAVSADEYQESEVWGNASEDEEEEVHDEEKGYPKVDEVPSTSCRGMLEWLLVDAGALPSNPAEERLRWHGPRLFQAETNSQGDWVLRARAPMFGQPEDSRTGADGGHGGGGDAVELEVLLPDISAVGENLRDPLRRTFVVQLWGTIAKSSQYLFRAAATSEQEAWVRRLQELVDVSRLGRPHRPQQQLELQLLQQGQQQPQQQQLRQERLQQQWGTQDHQEQENQELTHEVQQQQERVNWSHVGHLQWQQEQQQEQRQQHQEQQEQQQQRRQIQQMQQPSQLQDLVDPEQVQNERQEHLQQQQQDSQVLGESGARRKTSGEQDVQHKVLPPMALRRSSVKRWVSQ